MKTRSKYSVEQWIPVNGYEGLYSISSHGRVHRMQGPDTKRCPRIHFGHRKPNDYMIVWLFGPESPRRAYIHRLVADAFIPNPHGLPQVNHIDSDPSNNHVENLEWCNRSQNARHSAMVCRGNSYRQMTPAKVRVVLRCAEQGMSQTEIGNIFDVTNSCIYRVVHRKTWPTVESSLPLHMANTKEAAVLANAKLNRSAPQ